GDAVRRLSDCALRPLFLHGRDLRLPRGARRAGAAGAEEPARHDHRPLRRRIMAKRSFLIPGVDKRLLIKDSLKVMPDLTRRRFITGRASLGALSLLTGCAVVDSSSAEEMLKTVSKFNDAVQAFIFNPDALAPTFPESAITKPFPFNAYYDLDEAPEVSAADWKLEVRGL